MLLWICIECLCDVFHHSLYGYVSWKIPVAWYFNYASKHWRRGLVHCLWWSQRNITYSTLFMKGRKSLLARSGINLQSTHPFEFKCTLFTNCCILYLEVYSEQCHDAQVLKWNSRNRGQQFVTQGLPVKPKFAWCSENGRPCDTGNQVWLLQVVVLNPVMILSHPDSLPTFIVQCNPRNSNMFASIYASSQSHCLPFLN